MMQGHVKLISKVLVVLFSISSLICCFSLDGYGFPNSKETALSVNVKQPGNSTRVILPSKKIELFMTDGTESSWALPEIKKAYEYGLTYPGVMSNFRKNITREEFCTIVVKLYEKLSQKTATAGSSSFSDTKNPEVVKAWQLGIVNGTGGGKFSPGLEITRQEISVMIFRALGKAIPGLDRNTDVEFSFSDQNRIALWALEAMKFAKKHGILKGVGSNRIEPLMNTTREQAIAILKRAYETFKDGQNGGTGSENTSTGSDASTAIGGLKIDPGTAKGVISIDQTPLSTVLSEEEKAKMTDRKNKLAYPVYNTLLILKAAMGESKQSICSSADGAALIDENGSKKCRFTFALKPSRSLNVQKIVWQVSRVPFNGYADHWKKPAALVKSGEVSIKAGEFTVDFGSFVSVKSTLDRIRIGPGGILTWGGDGKYREIPTAQKRYYIRAVPVDGSGSAIGDPGTGVAVNYGRPVTDLGARNLTLKPSFEIWSTARQEMPSNKGEFPNLFEHKSSRTVPTGGNARYWFLFKGVPSSAARMVLEVSTKTFDNRTANWESPEGLVYFQDYKLPVTAYYSGEWTNSVPVDFGTFGPADKSMKPGDKVQYYLRAVILTPSLGAGCLSPAFSETMSVIYCKQAPVSILKSGVHTVKSYIPDVKIVHYQPIKREDPNWQHRYVVMQKPKLNEIKCTYTKGKDVLYPYDLYKNYYKLFGYDKQPSPDYYENVIIPKVLSVGTKVIIKPSEDNRKWYEKLWDSIVDFFKGIANFVKEMANWASEAYESVKSGLVSFVANNLPLPGPLAGWRDEIKTALEGLVNAGLMALGLPPTLPNFDKLCNEGLNYLAEVALTEANIPSNEITKSLISDTASAIGGEISKAYKKPTDNPLKAPFLKVDPDYLEQPAYMELEWSNPYGRDSLPGSFSISVTWPFNPSPYIDYTSGIQGDDAQLAFLTHFSVGLIRGAETYSRYPVFKPITGYKIPRLKPGEKLKARIYLEPYVGMPFPFAPQGDVVTDMDFRMMYFGHLGKVDFNVGTDDFALPDPREVAKAENFKGESDTYYTYRYDKTGSYGSFSRVASEAYPK